MSNIDFTRFSLETPHRHPYFKAVIAGSHWTVFLGTIGNNNYKYFLIDIDSASGSLCKEYWDKYEIRDEPRFNRLEMIEAIVSTVEKEGFQEMESGLQAFEKYWLSLSDQEKIQSNLNLIPSFVSLKDWYELSEFDHLTKNQALISNIEVREIEKQRWKFSVIEQIKIILGVYVRDGHLVPPVDVAHALELNRLLEWLETGKSDICQVPSITDFFQHIEVNESILDCYFGLVPQPAPNSPRLTDFVGKAHHYYHPYNITVYGAFLMPQQWDLLDCRIKEAEKAAEPGQVYTRENVFEWLKQYAKGFQIGFDSFDAKHLKRSGLSAFQDDLVYDALYAYVKNPFNVPALSESHGNPTQHLFSNWHNDGISAGYFYRAWYLIFDNHRVMKSRFEPNVLPTVTPSPKLNTLGLKDLISDNKRLFIMDMMEDLSFTSNGLVAVSERKKGGIRGISQALMASGVLPKKSLSFWVQQLAAEIGLKVNPKMAESKNSDSMEKAAIQYIRDNYKIKK